MIIVKQKRKQEDQQISRVGLQISGKKKKRPCHGMVTCSFVCGCVLDKRYLARCFLRSVVTCGVIMLSV